MSRRRRVPLGQALARTHEKGADQQRQANLSQGVPHHPPRVAQAKGRPAT